MSTPTRPKSRAKKSSKPKGEARTTRECTFRERQTRFIELLHKTPPKTVCPNFYLLAHANGCSFSPQCTYCYLKSSLWSMPKPQVFTNVDDMEKQVRAWINRDNMETYMLNLGNLSDSLSFEESRPLIARLVRLFREEAEARGRPHCMLLVTKGGRKQLQGLLEEEACQNVVVSFSVNAADAAAEYERGAASTPERLAALRALKKQGWRIRVRIDPMIRGFDYTGLIAKVKALRPERVTAGSLRAEPNLRRHGNNPLFEGLVESKGDLFARYPKEERIAMYQSVAKELLPICDVALCEESPEVWRATGLDPGPKKCNCAL